jgi:hypothetical protein
MAITSMVLIGAMTTLALGQGVHSLGSGASAPPSAGDRVSRPYQKIFTAQKPRTPEQLQEAAEILTSALNQQPRVVCGMVVVPVTPAIDPKMLAQGRQKDRNVEYKIRVIEPRICKE